jgi:regulatory protein
LRLRNSEPSSPGRACQYALKLLAARDYTTARLREKLRARDFDDADIESAITGLVSEGWLNDRSFAERFAESSLSAGRFFGPRLKLEMRRRGLPADLIDEVLAHLLVEHDEGEGARAVLERRFPGFSFVRASDKEKYRVVGFLQRRGFGLSTIMRVMRAEDI